MTRREETDPQHDRIDTEQMAAGHPDAGDPHPDTPEGTGDREDMPGAGLDTMDETADDDLVHARDPLAANGSPPPQAVPGERPEDHAPLLDDSRSERFRSRWHDVQASFVDDPQRAVREADQLVDELVQALATTFAERRQSLESRWQRGGDADTEDLRLALRGYHSFFDQLLPH